MMLTAECCEGDHRSPATPGDDDNPAAVLRRCCGHLRSGPSPAHEPEARELLCRLRRHLLAGKAMSQKRPRRCVDTAEAFSPRRDCLGDEELLLDFEREQLSFEVFDAPGAFTG